MDSASDNIKGALRRVLKTRHAAAYRLRALHASKLQRHRRLVFLGADGTGRKLLIVGKQLGEGGYATVWRVIEREPDGKTREMAVKRVVFDAGDGEAEAAVASEVTTMASLPPHPNILKLIGHCRRQRPGFSACEVYMLLELCGASLASHLQRRAGEPAGGGYGAAVGMDPLQTADVLRIFMDMCHAVAHLHARPEPIAHRDVKPENFLPSQRDGRWKLCDFGSATSETFVYRQDGSISAGQVGVEEARAHTSGKHAEPCRRPCPPCALSSLRPLLPAPSPPCALSSLRPLLPARTRPPMP